MGKYEDQPDREAIRLVHVCRALGDPLRLEAAALLFEAGELRCGDLAKSLGVPLSTLSPHLKTLREAGVTSARKEGTTGWSSLRVDDLNARFPGLVTALVAERSDHS